MSDRLTIRVINTHNTEENWSNITSVPEKGEIIIYDPDETHSESRFKIGDGKRNLNKLPFIVENTLESIFDITETTIYADGGRVAPPVDENS